MRKKFEEKLIENWPTKKYTVIYADPPWKCQTFAGFKLKSRDVPYPQMSGNEIKELPVKSITSDDAILFMWVIDSRLPIIKDLFESWGFTYKCVGFAWAKTARTTDGFNGGFSSYTKRDCEFCFIGTKGKYLNLKRNVNQILLESKTIHSKKPDEIRNRIVDLVGDVPRIELFARQKTEGWDAWGNEV